MLRSLPLLLAAGCAAKTVAVEVPAEAAVHVDTQRIAVVAADPLCRGVAHEIADLFQDRPDVFVDPTAPTRLVVAVCDEAAVRTVAIRRDGGRAHGWDARMTALLVVQSEDELVGRLVAIGGDSAGARPSHARGLRRTLAREVAKDVVEQLIPSGLVERRVFPGASPESSRGLQTRAVAAELAGDIDNALSLARAASALAPSPGLSDYIDDLQHRLLLSP